MPKTAYVTEPGAIDIARAEQILSASGVSCTPGDTEFTGASDAYDTLLIRNATKVGPDITSHFPNLKHVVRVGTGLDNVDTDFCKDQGIAVYNAPGANADAVAEYVACMALHTLRGMHLLNEHDVINWNRFKFRGHSIRHKTIGIIGFGNIGKLVHKKLRGLGCTSFLIYDPYLRAAHIEAYEHVHLAPLEILLAQADVISLHLPLTAETKQTIGAQNLDLLKPGAILINTARGGIVDENAVARRAAANQLTYVADTTENEPQVNPALLGQPNIVITPHIASLTADAEAAMLDQALHNFLADRPANI